MCPRGGQKELREKLGLQRASGRPRKARPPSGRQKRGHLSRCQSRPDGRRPLPRSGHVVGSSRQTQNIDRIRGRETDYDYVSSAQQNGDLKQKLSLVLKTEVCFFQTSWCGMIVLLTAGLFSERTSTCSSAVSHTSACRKEAHLALQEKQVERNDTAPPLRQHTSLCIVPSWVLVPTS